MFTILLYYTRMRHLKSSSVHNLAYRLATPALQLAPAMVVTRTDRRNGNKRVRCI